MENKKNDIENIEDNHDYDEKDEFQETLNDHEPEETDSVPIDPNKETIHFPWTIAIIIGVLMLLIIACFVIIMILGPEDPATSSSDISTVFGVKIFKFLYKILAIWYVIES